MCVLAFAWQAHPRWRLLLAGNRDELHARPALPLARWSEPDHLLAGRDLQSGGTWLGVSEQGRLAVVTNLRGFGAPEPGRASRGALVTDYLAGSGAYADPLVADLSAFNPVNLIVADRRGAHFLSNRPDITRSALASGLYGLSNGRLDEPWPKTMRLKSRLLDWITSDATDPGAAVRRPARTGPAAISAWSRAHLPTCRRNRFSRRSSSATRSMARGAARWWRSTHRVAASSWSGASRRTRSETGRTSLDFSWPG